MSSMNRKEPLLSLCIPTNGVKEWVFPVLESIYAQKIDNSLFEVVITDNGNNEDFYQSMVKYAEEHINLIYKRTQSYLFHNQIDVLNAANGTYLKFINHRAVMVEGSIEYLLGIISENIELKPPMFFSNGVLDKDYTCNSFDEYVKSLGKYASWTTGVGIWKEDYDQIRDNLTIDAISPHSCILYSRRKENLYKIYNNIFSKEVETDPTKKGKYDLFKAFGIEELAITQNLFIDGDISAETLKKVKYEYKLFLRNLYLDYCVRKIPCSYDLTGFDDAMGIYYNKYGIIIGAYVEGIKRLCKRRLKQ